MSNDEGTELAIKRTILSSGTSRGRPVLIVPGYGMNSFIFGFHPNGPSLEETLANAGLDVFSADLRGQGQSRQMDVNSTPATRRGQRQTESFGFKDLATTDLPKVVGEIRRMTNQDVDLIGCSLGTTIAFAYLAHHPRAPIGSVVSLGGLVTWIDVPTILRVAFASPRLAGALKIRGTRALARRALPFIAKNAPGLLSIYINPRSTDLSRADEMVQTVEDPNSQINEEIAHWVASRDLIVGGLNVSRAMGAMRHPLMCVVAKNDGIVPERTARGVYDQSGSTDKELLVVGDDDHPIAHADLFLSNGAQEKIFMPIANFLLSRRK